MVSPRAGPGGPLLTFSAVLVPPPPLDSFWQLVCCHIMPPLTDRCPHYDFSPVQALCYLNLMPADTAQASAGLLTVIHLRKRRRSLGQSEAVASLYCEACVHMYACTCMDSLIHRPFDPTPSQSSPLLTASDSVPFWLTSLWV